MRRNKININCNVIQFKWKVIAQKTYKGKICDDEKKTRADFPRSKFLYVQQDNGQNGFDIWACEKILLLQRVLPRNLNHTDRFT